MSRGKSKISEPIKRIAAAETNGPIMKTRANPQIEGGHATDQEAVAPVCVRQQVQLTCLIPARHFCSQRCGRIMCDLLERVAVNDPYVPSITEFNDAPRG